MFNTINSTFRHKIYCRDESEKIRWYCLWPLLVMFLNIHTFCASSSYHFFKHLFKNVTSFCPCTHRRNEHYGNSGHFNDFCELFFFFFQGGTIVQHTYLITFKEQKWVPKMKFILDLLKSTHGPKHSILWTMYTILWTTVLILTQ